MPSKRPKVGRLVLGLVVAALTVIVTFVIAIVGGLEAEKMRARVARTNEVLSQIDGVESAVKDVVAGARGFVIAADERFLVRMRDGRDEVGRRVERLRGLLVDDPSQRDRLDRLTSHLDATLHRVEATAERPRGNTLRPDETAETTLETLGLMDGVRVAAADLRTAEVATLEEHKAKMEVFRQKAVFLYIVLVFAVLVLLVILGWSLVRQTRVRRVAEAELEAREQLLRAIIEGTTDVVIVNDLDGRFRMVNAAAAAVTGHRPDEVVGRTYEDLLPADVAAKARASNAEAIEAGTAQTHETETTIGGVTRTWLVTKGPVRDAQGEITGLFGISRDITQRKAAETALRQMNADLARRREETNAANQELEAFSYSVSHDLRAPLRHIGGFVDLLSKRSSATMDSTSRRYLDTIASSARRMGELIDDLLAFSRMSRDTMRRDRVDLAEVVRSVVAEIEARGPGRRIEWRIGELPTVDGDGAMLRLALVNLLENAVKYSSTRESAVVDVAAVASETEFVLRVRDNGVGFDMRYVDKLFGVFQRLHRAEEFEGTGIGLANVRRIVQRHGGRVWAQSVLGEGATFFVGLPRAPAKTGSDHPSG